MVTLFYLFLQRWVAGKLPYEYQDGMSHDEAIHAMLASDNPFKAFATHQPLLGERPHSAEFLSLLEQARLWLEAWLKVPDKKVPAVD